MPQFCQPFRPSIRYPPSYGWWREGSLIAASTTAARVDAAVSLVDQTIDDGVDHTFQ